MKLTEVKEIAAQRGVKAGRAGKSELIRTMQRVEGNEACFDSGRAMQCDQTACLWRGDCDQSEQKRKAS